MSNRETHIIQMIRKNSSKAPKRYGIGDDGALLSDGSVVVMDSMIESVHFDERFSASDLGWKIVAINASDISAMGRVPDWATLALCIPEKLKDEWIADFCSGLHEALQKWNILLVGGDTCRSPGPISLSMTIGSRKGSDPTWRGGAQPGDDIWVSGFLGEAAAGFHSGDSYGLHALTRPEPPVFFGASLGGIASAMIDLSDGLMTDLHHICKESDVGAIIEPDRLPCGPALLSSDDPLPMQVAFGEDYELLFTAMPGKEDIIKRFSRKHRIEVTKIGRILSKESGVTLRDRDWPKAMFAHF